MGIRTGRHRHAPRALAALGAVLTIGVAGAGCAAGPGRPAATADTSAVAQWQAGAPAAWQDVLTRARAEGVVVVGGPAQLAAPMSAAFERDTGIRLQWIGATGGQLSARLQQEVGAGTVSMDLKLGGAQELLVDWRGLLVPIKDQLILPSVTAADRWRSGAIDWYDPDRAYMLKGSAYVYGWPVVNADVVAPDRITSWSDLLKPEYTGKIVSIDISQPSSGQGTAHFLWNRLGESYLRQLYGGQRVTFTSDYDQAMQGLSRGTYHVALGMTQSFVKKYADAGVKVVPVLPADHPGYLTSGFSVIMRPKGAPHPAAAQVFLNWYAGALGQQAYDSVMLEVSQRTDVDLRALPDYLKPKAGTSYWIDSDLDWYLNRRGQVNQLLVTIAGGR